MLRLVVPIFAVLTCITAVCKLWSDTLFVTDIQRIQRQKDTVSSLLGEAKQFTLVLQANVRGGTADFLQSILTPDCVVITPLLEITGIISQYSQMPTTDLLKLTMGALTVKTSSQDFLAALGKNNGKFHKVFINHPLGFSLSFLHQLFQLEKRYMAVTHDYIWVLDKLQVTFADCHSPEGAARNYAFKMLLPQIEMKSQHNATKANYAVMDQFKSLEVVPFPDYMESKDEKLPTSSELVIGVIGDISWIKGLDAVLKISRESDHSPDNLGSSKCGLFEVGNRFIQLGSWRISDVDGLHLSFSHKEGQTAVIFRNDGTTHYGPRKQFNTWKESGPCEKVEILSGADFIQVGNWRFGDSGGNFILSHRSDPTHPIVLGRSEAEKLVGDLWNRPLEESGNVLVGPEALQIGRWLLLYEEKQLTLAHEQYGATESFFSSGYSRREEPQGRFRVPHSSWCSLRNATKNVRVVVFGRVATQCGAGTNLILQPYRDVEEFNKHMRDSAPNVLLVTANWPETYSLTLTLAMLTNLPIIVKKSKEDFRAAIPERAKQYRKAYFHDFEDAASVVALARQIKASSFTEVSPEFRVPVQWQYLMHPHLYNVVLVASKIITSKQPLSYTPMRSRFSVHERFTQTLETIASIRTWIPNSFVVLIDNSRLEKEITSSDVKMLVNSVDIFVNDVDNSALRRATDESPAKQLGEAMLLLQGLDALEEKQIMHTQLFKLTGRYLINKYYDHRTFQNPHNIFKLAKVGKSVDLGKDYYAYTCFFNVGSQHVSALRWALSKVVSDITDMTANKVPILLHDDVESRLALLLPDVKYVPKLGVTQRVSTWDTPDKDI